MIMAVNVSALKLPTTSHKLVSYLLLSFYCVQCGMVDTQG